VTPASYVASSRRHFGRRSLFLGIACFLAAALIVADLLVGYSVRASIEANNLARIGRATHLLVARSAFISDLDERIAASGDGTSAASWLELPLVAVTAGTRQATGIAAIGISSRFLSFFPDEAPSRGESDFAGHGPARGEVWLNRATADRLGCVEGDRLSLRVPSVPSGEVLQPEARAALSSVDRVCVVTRVLPNRGLGRFQTAISQSAPLFAMMNRDELAEAAGLAGLSNRMLVAASGDDWEVPKGMLSLADSGLSLESGTRGAVVKSRSYFLSSSLVRILRALDPAGRAGYAAFLTGAQGPGGEYPFLFMVSEEGERQTRVSSLLVREVSAAPGDSLSVRFFRFSPEDGTLSEDGLAVTVDAVEPDSSFLSRRGEIPDFPGLDEDVDCRDWRSGLPLDLSRVTRALEDDWNRNGKRPLISVDSETARRISPDPVSFRLSASHDAASWERAIEAALTMEAIGMRAIPIRSELKAASRGSVDFTALFSGMSFFLFLALWFLHAVVVRQYLALRRGEAALLAGLGFTPSTTASFFLRELHPLFILSGSAGCVAGVALVRLFLAALRGVWYGIVRTDVLDLYLAPWVFPVAFALSVIPSLAITALQLRAWTRKSTASGMSMPIPLLSTAVLHRAIVAGLLCLFCAIFAIAGAMRWKQAEAGLAFLSGAAFLSALLFLYRFFAKRESSRDFTFIAVAALSLFLVAAVSANRRVMLFDLADSRSPTGGRPWLVRTALPVSPDAFPETGLIPFALYGTDAANCLNLHALARPALLGFDATTMDAGRVFRLTDGRGREIPWESLSRPFDDGSIPVAVDASALKWSLKGNIGDRLSYPDGKGGAVTVTICALVNDSVFQGYLYMSDANLYRAFPSISGDVLFLAGGDGASRERSRYERIFSPWGGSVVSTREALEGFMELENTYLRVFQSLSAFALLLGFVGVGILVRTGARDDESRADTLRALGFSAAYLRRSLYARYASRFLVAAALSAVALPPAVFGLILAGRGMTAAVAVAGLYGVVIPAGLGLMAFAVFMPASRPSPRSGRT